MSISRSVALAALAALGAAVPSAAQSVTLTEAAPAATAIGTNPFNTDPFQKFGSLSITAQTNPLTLSAGQTLTGVGFGVLTLATGDTMHTPRGTNENFSFTRPITFTVGADTFTATESFTGTVATTEEDANDNPIPGYTNYSIGTAAQAVSLGSYGSLLIGAMGGSGHDTSNEYAPETIPLAASVTFIAPAPEPSQSAGLGLGVLGLAGLALRARRRRAAA